MGIFQWLSTKISGKRTDEEILAQLASVAESDANEILAIVQSLKNLKDTWRSFNEAQRMLSWRRIHGLIKAHEEREQILAVLDAQLTQAEEDSILVRAHQDAQAREAKAQAEAAYLRN